MATFNKFQDFVEQLAKGVHVMGTHTLKATLGNTAPSASLDAVYADLPTQLSTANGYTSGGPALDSVTLTETGGTATLAIADEVITASGGSIGPFQYVSMYNDTPTSPADPLIQYYDAGSVTLADTETFTIDFGASGLWTLA
jgi:hypothetical protein